MSITAQRVWDLLEENRKDILDAADEPELAGEFDLRKNIGSWTFPLYHPSGFQAIGFNFEVDPGRVARTIAHLDDEQADEYVHCIADWLWTSTLDFAEGVWTNEAIALSFTTKHPSSAVCLTNVAQHNGESLVGWLFGYPYED